VTDSDPHVADIPSKRVLVVDEDQALAQLLAQRLIAEDFRVTTCDNAERALALARAGHFDVAILDLRLLAPSGDGARQELRALAGNLRIIGTHAGAEIPAYVCLFAVLDGGEDPLASIDLVHRAYRDRLERLNLQLSKRLGAETQKLEASRLRAETTLQTVGEGVITLGPDGRIDSISPVAEQLTQFAYSEAVGHPIAEVYRVLDEETREPMTSVAERCREAGMPFAGSAVLVGKRGKEAMVEDSARPVPGDGDTALGIVLAFRNVTQAREAALHFARRATHDAVTGLLNRREFERRLATLFRKAEREGVESALLYLDLDRFTGLNERCGHTAGDQLLRQVSAILHERVRERDSLARLGEDEFGVLLEHCDLSQALVVAEGLREEVGKFPFVWEGVRYALGVSIGIVPVGPGSESLTSILSAAESACYAAKDAGRNRIHVGAAADLELAERHGRMRWVKRINEGIEQNRFCLVAQDIAAVAAADDGCERFEVLVRLREEGGELLSPEFFVPAAERYSLMPALDRWVIRSVCRWFANHPARLSRLALCSINLSGQSLGNEQLADYILEQFELACLPLAPFCFEITETAAIVDLRATRRLLDALRGHGARIALDDFGSGLSSYPYLKHLAVDILKIDGGFVQDIARESDDYAMVQAINDMGHIMGMQTIAEFVQNDLVLAKLREIGVDYAQGNGIARPRLLEDQ
jgi:diguanylate cyclase (GGDEF)-like protein/PAS domain S-box-containing protein